MAHANFIESGETVTARPSILITGGGSNSRRDRFAFYTPHTDSHKRW